MVGNRCRHANVDSRAWAVLLFLALWHLPAAVAAAPLRLSGEPVPRGDLHFVDEDTLLVPYARIRTPKTEELAAERARREGWLARPTDVIVDELVKREPGEPEGLYRFRRWMARAYVEFVKANAGHALEAGVRYATETGVRIVDVTPGGLTVRGRVPVWQGLAEVQTQISGLGGLGAGAIERTTEMVNLQVGVAAGERWIALWSWPERGSRDGPRGPSAVLDDRGSLQPVGPAGELRPVIWTGPDRLLALVPQGNRWVAALVDVEPGSDGVDTRVVREFPEPVFGAGFGPVFPVLLPPPEGEARFVLFGHRLDAAWLDLGTGRSGRIRSDATPWNPWMAALSGIRLVGGRAFFTGLSNRWQVVAVRDVGGRIVVDGLHGLPAVGGFWGGPIAAVGDALLLLGDPGIWREQGPGVRSGGSSGTAELWRFDPGTGELQPLELPRIPFRVTEGNGALVAVAPGRSWRAARVSGDTVEVRRLPDRR
jgi:hypothetical protein